MNLFVISGSARKESNTSVVSTRVYHTLKLKKDHITFFDLASERSLPVLSGEESDHTHPAVIKLRDYAEKADGFVICTPEYHNGVSGALKNALDFLDATHFKGKTCAMIAVSGGGKGGMNALNQLRLVLRSMYAHVLPEQFVIDAEQIQQHQSRIDKNSQEKIESLLRQLIHITQQFSGE